MNTCAECRFWQREPDQAPDALAECGLYRDRERYVKFDAGGYFTTRSDFGCVQFEKAVVGLTGIPIGETRVTNT